MTRVVITGSHGVGKTTLCHALLEALTARGVSACIAPEPIREIAKTMAGRPLLERRLRLLAEHFRRLALGADRLCLYDRSLLDMLVYGRHVQAVRGLDGGGAAMDALISELLRHYRREIDLFLYLPIEFDLTPDPDAPHIRATRQPLDDALRAAAQANEIELIPITGDVPARVAAAMQLIAARVGLPRGESVESGSTQ